MSRNGRVDCHCRQKLAGDSFDVATVLRHLALAISAEQERRVAMRAVLAERAKPRLRKENWVGAGDQNRTGVLSLGS